VSADSQIKAKDRAVYQLTLRSGVSSIPETIRLRSALKVLLRRFDFKALKIEKVKCEN
jgi:hypothetical protein